MTLLFPMPHLLGNSPASSNSTSSNCSSSIAFVVDTWIVELLLFLFCFQFNSNKNLCWFAFFRAEISLQTLEKVWKSWDLQSHKHTFYCGEEMREFTPLFEHAGKEKKIAAILNTRLVFVHHQRAGVYHVTNAAPCCFRLACFSAVRTRLLTSLISWRRRRFSSRRRCAGSNCCSGCHASPR